MICEIAGLLEEDPEAAETHLLKSLALDDGNAQSWFWLGHTQNSLGKPLQAKENYARLVSLDPLWNRSLYASEYVAALGDVETAGVIDQARVAASTEDWQENIADALRAKQAGDWSGLTDPILEIKDEAPRNKVMFLLGFATSTRSYRGLSVDPIPQSRGFMMVEFDIANRRVPEMDALNPGPGSEIWANPFVALNAPALLLLCFGKRGAGPNCCRSTTQHSLAHPNPPKPAVS